MIGPTNASPKNTVLTDNVQTISAVKTFTASPIVPDTPSGTHAAVNQSYVESTVDGVNNLVHKTGNENISGIKTFNRSVDGRLKGTVVVPAADTTNWYEVCSFKYTTAGSRLIRIDVYGNYGTAIIHFTVYLRQQSVYISDFYSTFNINYSNIVSTGKTVDGKTHVRLFMKTPTSCRISARLLGMENYGNEISEPSAIEFAYGNQTPYASLNPSDFDEMHEAVPITNSNDYVTINSAQTVVGTKTFSSSPVVPDAPADTHSAVNQAYVESTVDGINNLVHKSGNETFVGTKQSNTLQCFNSRPYLYQRVNTNNDSEWFKVFTLGKERHTLILDVISNHQTYNTYGVARAIVFWQTEVVVVKWLYKYGGNQFPDDCIFVGVNSNIAEIWVKSNPYAYNYVEINRAVEGYKEMTISSVSNVYNSESGVATIDTTVYTAYAYSSVIA